jgi:hypothetical protein
MKMFLTFLFSAQVALAVTPADFNACVQSYRPHSTVRFNVTSSGTASDRRLIYANSWKDKPGINIYHKGAFWFASLENLSDTRGDKVARITLGDDVFCLKFNLKLVLTDRFVLSRNGPACASGMNLQFQKSELPYNERLASRIKSDIDLGQFCFADIVTSSDFKCTAERKEEDFRKIKSWNTAACKKLDDPAINRMIARHEKILVEYPRRRAGAVPASAPAPAATPEVQRSN